MSTARTELRVTDVTKTFGGVTALERVSLEVRAGEVHALLGENGAGKSTLISVAAGAIEPDEGAVEIGGQRLEASNPRAAQALGLGVVYQHPAIADDLSVLENMVLAMPRDRRPAFRNADSWVRERLEVIGAVIDPRRRASELTAAEQQQVEIAKALALEPRVLILDEPTAALSAGEVEQLFQQVRRIRDRGTAVVYISHRIPEVTEIADRLTVLRDGRNRGTFAIGDVSEDDILDLIVGRQLEAVFPDKRPATDAEAARVLEVRGLSGEAFDGISFDVGKGEIVGVAGVAGNGQRELLRALAGLEPHDGEVLVRGERVRLANPQSARSEGFFYIPADRQREGLFASLTVRENAAATSLDSYARAGFVRSRSEARAVDDELAELSVKAPSADVGVMTLSGGNQQKVVFARTLLGEPDVLLCDEPTQGVDVGARVEIYRLLRQLANEGKAIIVCSSDALELEGLCDRVLIMSRGTAVASLSGEEVTEGKITGSAVKATSARRDRGPRTNGSANPLKQFLKGDNVAVPVLIAVIAGFAIYTGAENSDFLSAFNLTNVMLLATALMLVSIGQLVVLLTAGVDLSVGPFMALGLVVFTAFAQDGKGLGGVLVGLGLLLAVAIVVGLVNGSLVRFAKINPVIATLATFIGLQGVALLINPVPEGLLSADVYEFMTKTVGGTIPIVFIVVLAIAAGGELVLRRSRLGLALRAVGSDELAAHRIGVRVGPVLLLAYVLCSVFAALAAIMLAVQIGTGDATAGQNYTLQSIAAVVLGGASIYGGRGSVLGAVLGGLLLTEVISGLTFLQLGEAWQFWLPGGIVLVSAWIYARAVGVRFAPAAEEA